MDISSLSERELDELLNLVAEDIANIKTQVGFAKSEAASTGKYSGSVWFRKASHALRMKGIEHQRLLQERSRRRRERGAVKSPRDLSNHFVDLCRERLSPELFASILDAAKELHQESANG
jgi:hypothetical protein